MNTNTGELVRYKGTLSKKLQKSFIPVPDRLLPEVEKELAGRDMTVVDFENKSALADWARQRRESKELAAIKNRKAKKVKARRHMGKKSRGINRKH